MTMLEFEYTVDPTEPSTWQDSYELMRDAMLSEGRTEHDVRVAWAKDLKDLRARRNAREQQEQAEAYAHLRAIGFTFVEDKANTNGHVDLESDTPTAHFAGETWSEFRDHTDEQVDYLVEGLIAYGSLVFLASEPKAGKTWLALALAVSIATGTEYLGRYPVRKPQPVLYLALEGHRTDYRTRIGTITRGHNIDPDSSDLDLLTIAYQPIGIDLMDPAWADALKDEIVRTGARTVFVDVLRDGAPKLREDGQGSNDFSIIKRHLKPLLKAGVTIVLVHHFVKRNESNRKRTIGDMMSGSGSLYGAADLVIGITTNAKEWENMRVDFVGRLPSIPDPFRVQATGNRNGKYGGFAYRDALSLVTAAENAERAKPTWLFAEKIAAWIIEQGRLVSVGEISKQFDVASSTINDNDDDLEKCGITHIINYENRRLSGYQATNGLTDD